MRDEQDMSVVRAGASSGIGAAIALSVARSAHRQGATWTEMLLITGLAVALFLAACYRFWPPSQAGRSRRRMWLLALPLLTTFYAVASSLAVMYLP